MVRFLLRSSQNRISEQHAMGGKKFYAICNTDSIASGWIYPFTLERLNSSGEAEPFSIMIVCDMSKIILPIV